LSSGRIPEEQKISLLIKRSPEKKQKFCSDAHAAMPATKEHKQVKSAILQRGGQKKTSKNACSQEKGKMKWNMPGVRHNDTLPFNCFIFAPVNIEIN